MHGPLKGLSVLEVAGAGPVPFCGMVLADLGADVVRVDRAGGREVLGLAAENLMGRGKRSVGVDLKRPEGAEVVLRLVAGADVLLEGFRPGVAERLGIGPDACLARNSRLVYGRGTGWGQTGPLAERAGHDINYVAVAGALEPIGRAGERPVPPLNLVGDFGGGGMLLTVGVLSALVERAVSGRGQVVDAAMVDGVALLTTVLHELRRLGVWSDERESNLVDGGAPFYDTYETADGRYVAIGAMEPQFWEELLRVTGLDGGTLPDRMDRAQWPELRRRLAAVFRTRTQQEWTAAAAGSDACLTPVLSLAEAPGHPLNTGRGVFLERDGIVEPAPAPRFSRTPAGPPEPAPKRGSGTDAVLGDRGFDDAEISALRASGIIG